MILHSRTRTLDLAGRTGIVGVLNVTPDSFYDGGKHKGIDAALSHAGQLLAEGADIVEIGGESTGPGSQDISAEDERSRVLPVVEAIRRKFPDAWIAVDTTKAGVAEPALLSGADLINDVSAGRGDPRMFRVIAKAECPCILMYSKDSTSRTTVGDRRYTDVVDSIRTFLIERIAAAEEQGIKRDRIILDPGLGHFVSSDPSYSFEILNRLREFTDLGPILVSPSRKSFLAGPKHLPVAERLPATLEASVLAVKNGASFIRTHDVGATVKIM